MSPVRRLESGSACDTSRMATVGRSSRAPSRPVPVRPLRTTTLEPGPLVSWLALGFLEAFKDQIQPELELVCVVVAGLHCVLGDQLGQVRVLVGGDLLEDALRYLRRLL